ncbi:hypothetical protein [Hoylesella pleuritidis]|jgi:hypothetical protein|uniref:Uncharacterized protein n=1 Tax=Hoylesella pleuritidis F0068 TaxID=1081904 RepID=U2KSD8_9BACT|nr:hypothetical protein [Hoylesella pleuritidis]ERK01402.1 hypothetical protein HMPREF1218_1682 [Hoylesella pleuritidis F0068]
MSDKEIELYLKTLDEGLKAAERQMLEEETLYNESVTIRDENNQIVNIPAKDLLAKHFYN